MSALSASLVGKLIDLHIHVDGSLSIDIARRLAALDGQTLDCSDAELFNRLSVGEDCKDLNEYLEKFAVPLALLQTPEQLSECLYLLQEELRERGCVYAELRFAPQSHTERGLTQREVLEAALAGLRRSSFESRLILCCMRGSHNRAANLETAALAAQYLGNEVVALDLAGAEALFPTSDYAELFAYARAAGVPVTIHAGEAAGPESVRCALAFGARRIGHGVRAIEDAMLVHELAASGVFLEICPSSELQTGALSDAHCSVLARLLAAGVPLTVNSDNMSVSNTWVGHEFDLLHETLGLTQDDAIGLLQNALEASFADEHTKTRLRACIQN